jgi:hypothetical protein
MGNANGKFNATTIALYNCLDLIQQRTYKSKKTAAKVMTNQSAKALHLVKSGFLIRSLGTGTILLLDGLSHASRSTTTNLPLQSTHDFTPSDNVLGCLLPSNHYEKRV